MTKFEKFTFKNEKGKYFSGIVVAVTENYYIIDFLGGKHQTVPITFFDNMERIL